MNWTPYQRNAMTRALLLAYDALAELNKAQRYGGNPSPKLQVCIDTLQTEITALEHLGAKR